MDQKVWLFDGSLRFASRIYNRKLKIDLIKGGLKRGSVIEIHHWTYWVSKSQLAYRKLNYYQILNL